MYHCLGLAETLKSLIAFSVGGGSTKSASCVNSLRKAYKETLGKKQPNTYQNTTEDIFIRNESIVKQLIKSFEGHTLLDDKKVHIGGADFSEMSTEKALSAIALGLAYLGKYQENLHTIFKLCITSLFYYRSNTGGGGSSSSSIGVIWCGIRKNWLLQDCVEFLIHELTHHLLFIDERVYGHYVSYAKLAEKGNYAHSAILKCNRPLDKVFHSLVVATELLASRCYWLDVYQNRHYTIHPSPPELLINCYNTIESMDRLPNLGELVVDRFLVILNQVKSTLNHISKKL
jgi:hypothetical protein